MTVKIAVLTVSDRAARGEYEDRGGPACEDWLRRVITTPIAVERRIVAEGQDSVAAALTDLADNRGAELILVTGGTGPAPRDRTPEAVASVIDFDLPGFGEAMRAANGKVVATAILSPASHPAASTGGHHHRGSPPLLHRSRRMRDVL